MQSTDFNFLSRMSTATVIVSFTTNVDDAFITILSIIFKNKSIKSDKMRLYKDLSVNEHVRWFREIDIKYMMSLEYFFINVIKIVYYMQFLKDDLTVQWYQHLNENALLSKNFYAKFMTFLLNLITNLINRRFFAYERWKEIKQRFDQKMLAFKTHLKKLKTQLFKFNQKHIIMIFLAKLKQNLKFKIISINSVSHLRKNLLTLIIM